MVIWDTLLGRVPIYRSHSRLFARNDIRSCCILIRSSGFTIRVYSRGEAKGERIPSEKNAKFERRKREGGIMYCQSDQSELPDQSKSLRDGQTDGSIILLLLHKASCHTVIETRKQ